MDLQGALDVETDGGVRFSFLVTDAGQTRVELRFRSGMATDIAVRDGGTEVWRFSDGRLFTQAPPERGARPR